MLMRLSRLTIAGLGAGMMMMSFLPAHAADPTVKISTANNSTLFSLPPNPAGWTDATPRAVTGTATFDVGAEGAVTLTFSQTPVLGRPDTNHPENAVNDITNPKSVIVHQDLAALTCDATNACTWSYTLPFGLTPGAYHISATPTQGIDAGAPASIDVTIV